MSYRDMLWVDGADIVHVLPLDPPIGYADLGEDDISLSDYLHAMQIAVVKIDETSGSGSYTANVAVPENWSVVDVEVVCNTAWTAVTAATLIIGNAADPDGFFTAVNLKTASGILSYRGKSSGVGAFAGLPKQFTAAGAVTIHVTTTGGGGGAGYTLVFVRMCRRVMNAEKG